MRRPLIAGAGLGIVAGLLFALHDAVALSVAWPILLGFAMWESVGPRGARAAPVALAGAAGTAMGYGTFAFAAEFLPVTATGLGIAVGVAVAILVAGGLLLGGRLPLPGLLIGYAGFVGVFEPRWREAASNIRLHGFEDLTVTLLGVMAGILAVTLVRAIADPAPVSDGEPASDEMDDAAVRGEAS